MKEDYIKVHIKNLKRLREEHGDKDAIYETLTDVLNMLSLPLSNSENLLNDRFKAEVENELD
jgi:hypothetical protein